MMGYYTGVHAPGLTELSAGLQATHNLLLSHGLAVQTLRAASQPALNVGITLNLSPVHPGSDRAVDVQAAWRNDGYNNRIFLDPLFRGAYPQDMVAYFGAAFPRTSAEDMQLIQAPIDFLGINYYTRAVVIDDPTSAHLGLRHVMPKGNEYSQMWEIYPNGLYELLTRVSKDYQPGNIYITENGIPVADGVDQDGRVRDYRRVRYVKEHLERCHAAIQSGVPLKGYFHGSLLDNFEWAHGYDMRFGMVYVDFESQQRVIKDSGLWYANVIRNNGVDPSFHPC
jgi:beta-glucosidase